MSANLRTQRVASSLYTQSLVWKSFRCTENILSKIKLKCVHLCVYQKARASKRWRAKHQRRENHVKMCILYMYFVLLLSSMGWYLRMKKKRRGFFALSFKSYHFSICCCAASAKKHLLFSFFIIFFILLFQNEFLSFVFLLFDKAFAYYYLLRYFQFVCNSGKLADKKNGKGESESSSFCNKIRNKIEEKRKRRTKNTYNNIINTFKKKNCCVNASYLMLALRQHIFMQRENDKKQNNGEIKNKLKTFCVLRRERTQYHHIYLAPETSTLFCSFLSLSPFFIAVECIAHSTFTNILLL